MVLDPSPPPLNLSGWKSWASTYIYIFPQTSPTDPVKWIVPITNASTSADDFMNEFYILMYVCTGNTVEPEYVLCFHAARAATDCKSLQQTASHCNILQRTAYTWTHCNQLVLPILSASHWKVILYLDVRVHRKHCSAIIQIWETKHTYKFIFLQNDEKKSYFYFDMLIYMGTGNTVQPQYRFGKQIGRIPDTWWRLQYWVRFV